MLTPARRLARDFAELLPAHTHPKLPQGRSRFLGTQTLLLGPIQRQGAQARKVTKCATRWSSRLWLTRCSLNSQKMEPFRHTLLKHFEIHASFFTAHISQNFPKIPPITTYANIIPIKTHLCFILKEFLLSLPMNSALLRPRPSLEDNSLPSSRSLTA